jgi:hypothetical protein
LHAGRLNDKKASLAYPSSHYARFISQEGIC